MSSLSETSDYPDYYPALPFTLIIDDPMEDQEQRDLGHEFVLHFDPAEEKYFLYFFKDAEMAKALKEVYDRSNTRGKVAKVVAFDARLFLDHFGVRYFDEYGTERQMSMSEYRRNMELKNEFRRDND